MATPNKSTHSRSSPADDALKSSASSPAGRSAGDKNAASNPKRSSDTDNTDNIDLGAEPTGVGRGTEAGTRGRDQDASVNPGNQTRSREQQGVEEGAHLPTEHAPKDPRNNTSEVGEDPENMLL